MYTGPLLSEATILYIYNSKQSYPSLWYVNNWFYTSSKGNLSSLAKTKIKPEREQIM